MLSTTVDMYKAFLDGIKKSEAATVIPSVFNRIINDWGQDEWISKNAMVPELNQKQIDDLSQIRVVTDDEFIVSGTLMRPIGPDTGKDYQFTIPKDPTANINYQQLDGNTGTQNYPRYLRLLNVMFKLSYVDNECDLEGVSDWIGAEIMRSDQRIVILDNPLRRPKDNRLYYEMLEDKIRLITGTSSTGYAMRLEYFRYPVEIFINESNLSDTGNPATGSVNCEFQSQQRKEIVDIAVRTYLERVKDPRYQSFLNEELIKSQNK